MKTFLTEADLSGYLKALTTEVDSTKTPDGVGGGPADIIPDIPETKKEKFEVNPELIKSITITKTYRGIKLPEQIYDDYLKNNPNAKVALVAFVERGSSEPEIEIDMQEDITNN